jgi:ActR/RegA family two-component response regulator
MAQRKTLLLVDDDDDLRGALAEQLALHEEFAVAEAPTAGEGVRMARSSSRTWSCWTSTCPTWTAARPAA